MSNETLFYTVHILLLTLVLAGCGASTGNDHPAGTLQSSSHSAASSAQVQVNSSSWSSTSSANVKSTIPYNKKENISGRPLLAQGTKSRIF
jgi:hypothetical protein